MTDQSTIDNCLFCTLKTHRTNLENGLFYHRWDYFPIAPGHSEIIPIRHIPDLASLNDCERKVLVSSIETAIEMIESVDFRKLYQECVDDPYDERTKKACEQMFSHMAIDKKPDSYNMGINQGLEAGQTIPHLHIHIIPRYKGDVENPRGGVRNIIPEKGDY